MKISVVARLVATNNAAANNTEPQCATANRVAATHVSAKQAIANHATTNDAAAQVLLPHMGRFAPVRGFKT